MPTNEPAFALPVFNDDDDEYDLKVNRKPIQFRKLKKPVRPQATRVPSSNPTGSPVANRKPMSSSGQDDVKARRNPGRQVSSAQSGQRVRPQPQLTPEPDEMIAKSINTPRPGRKSHQRDEIIDLESKPGKAAAPRAPPPGTSKISSEIKVAVAKPAREQGSRPQPQHPRRSPTPKRAQSQEFLQVAKRAKNETTVSLLEQAGAADVSSVKAVTKYNTIPCIPCIRTWAEDPTWLCQIGEGDGLPCANCPNPISCEALNRSHESIRLACQDLHIMAAKARCGREINQQEWTQKLELVRLTVSPEYLIECVAQSMQWIKNVGKPGIEAATRDIKDLRKDLGDKRARVDRLDTEVSDLRADIDGLLQHNQEISQAAEEDAAQELSDEGENEGEELVEGEQVEEQGADSTIVIQGDADNDEVGEPENTNGDDDGDDGDGDYQEE